MTTKTIKITPEVRMDAKILFLIRMDGEEMAFADSSKDALLIVDSLAAAEQKRLEGDWTKVFRQDLNDGQKVIISTQALGYSYNGGINKAVTIDFISVGHAFLIKGRHELRQDEEEETRSLDDFLFIELLLIIVLAGIVVNVWTKVIHNFIADYSVDPRKESYVTFIVAISITIIVIILSFPLSAEQETAVLGGIV